MGKKCSMGRDQHFWKHEKLEELVIQQLSAIATSLVDSVLIIPVPMKKLKVSKRKRTDDSGFAIIFSLTIACSVATQCGSPSVTYFIYVGSLRTQMNFTGPFELRPAPAQILNI